MLRGGVHLERTRVAVSILRLPCQRAREAAGVRIHVVLMLLHL